MSPSGFAEEEGEISHHETGVPSQDLDQQVSEEQNYRETVRGVRLFMGWCQVPDFDSVSSAGDDHTLAGPRSQPTGKISVKLPEDKWLGRKMSKLNLTIVKSYPSKCSEANGLSSEQVDKIPVADLLV